MRYAATLFGTEGSSPGAVRLARAPRAALGPYTPTCFRCGVGMLASIVRRSAGRAAVVSAALLCAPLVGAQITSLPFDLVDVADNPLAPDHCGIDFTYVEFEPTDLSETGGATIADFDNDGLLDIFLPQNKNAPSRLYRNLGGFQFVDEAVARGVDDPGWATGDGLFFDYDHDGDLDLLTAIHLGKSTLPLGPTALRLFRNTGAAGGYTFTNVTATAGFVFGSTAKLTKFGWAAGICVGDFNHDGWPDFFSNWDSLTSSQDQWRLFRNAPNPTPGDPNDPNYTPRIFIDATVGSGLEGEYGGRPNQPQFWDVNRDGWPDLHINGDATLDQMFINNKNGTFTNVATAVGLNGNPPEFRNEMGSALGDPDNDLDQDLHLTNIAFLDRFYRNDSVKGALSFTDIAIESGLHDSNTGWGTGFLDLDNDGDVDHLAVTGPAHPALGFYYNPAHLNLFPEMLNGNAGVKWADIRTLVPDWSASDSPVGDNTHGMAYGDLDNDGDVDLVVTRNAGEKAGVFKNTLVSANDWLQVDLIESGGSRDTTGARVYVKQNGVIQMREHFTGSSVQSQDAPRLHFGLGKAQPKRSGAFGGAGTAAGATALGGGGAPVVGPTGPGGSAGPFSKTVGPAWLVVRWPHGASQIVMHPPRNTILTITRSAVDDTGDLNADGHLTAVDLAMLQLLVTDPQGFATAYPNSPGPVTGDVDFNGFLDADDLTAWSALPPH